MPLLVRHRSDAESRGMTIDVPAVVLKWFDIV